MVDETDQNCREKSNSARKKLDAQKPTKIEDVPFRCTYSLENFHLNIDPILFYLSYIHCSIHASTGKFPFGIFSFITHESTRVHIYWGLQSEGTMPLHRNRVQICFSWVLASQDPIHSNNCRADCLPGYMYIFYRIRKP